MRQQVTTALVSLFYIMLMTSIALANTATIDKVVSGDRVKIKGWEIVRLTGIIAPGLDEDFGKEACQFARRELEGKLVVISTYTINNTAEGIVRDEEGLCLVNIKYGGDISGKGESNESGNVPLDFNALMLEKGFARVDHAYLPDFLKHYLEIERVAKDKKLGIWSETR